MCLLLVNNRCVRLCRYSLLLKELLKMDPSKSAALQAVLHDLMKVAEHVNEGVRTRHVLVGCRGVDVRGNCFGHGRVVW